jgi:hypothetical protein
MTTAIDQLARLRVQRCIPLAVKACAYVFLALLALVAQATRAEVIFFDDSRDQDIRAPLSARWVPGHSGGRCTSSTATPGSLCSAGTDTDEAVWGFLLPPSPGATVDTDVTHYGGLPPLPFNDFLWVIEPEHGHGVPGIFGDYLINLVDPFPGLQLYLQFNSAVPDGFQCTAADHPAIGTCDHTIDGSAHGVITAGYVRWSDESFDQIVFESADHHVPAPSVLLLLAAGFLALVWVTPSGPRRTAARVAA